MTISERNIALARWRGLALEMVHSAFRKRFPAYDHIMLADVMRSMGQDVGENDVIFILRQLHDREYLTYREDRNRLTNEISIVNVQISPKGCDVAEKFIEDPSVIIR